MAHDIDMGQNREVRFYIDSGNTDDSFTIDSTTGIVSTAQTLDREVRTYNYCFKMEESADY